MTRENKKLIRRRLIGAYSSSVISVSLVLLLVGVASFIIANASRVSDFFKENLQMSVILKTEVSDSEAETILPYLDSLPFIHSRRFVSREEGTAELKEMLGDDFLDVFESSPVPVSVEVTLEADYVSADSLNMVSFAIMESPLVDEVVCRQSLVDALNANLQKISIVLGVFILLMLVVSFVQIGNTVRINIFAKRFTVHTMRLVGATRAFIVRPFLARSIIQGLVSAVIASAMMAGGILYVRKNLPQFSVLFGPREICMVAGITFVSAIVICTVSTLFTVNKLVSMSRDEIYY